MRTTPWAPDGHISSLDDEVTDYVPQLTGSGYDGVTIRHLFTMSSGVEFDEDYDSPLADVNMIFIRAFALEEPMLDHYANLERERPPGTSTTTSAPTRGSWPRSSATPPAPRSRDYLRLGRLYLNEGRRDGQQVLPVGWVEASTTPEAPHLQGPIHLRQPRP
ncbi:beta-lactamase family protein [Nesterenkonia sp. LB17]|uniref:serine hydrolase n=1 Tax=Nesterenkonia sp. LB17 TaxID=2901230 RepID=UPI001F4CA6EF|nr:beta-lactamase family protein [Nesterenkonia sp. LB17]